MGLLREATETFNKRREVLQVPISKPRTSGVVAIFPDYHETDKRAPMPPAGINVAAVFRTEKQLENEVFKDRFPSPREVSSILDNALMSDAVRLDSRRSRVIFRHKIQHRGVSFPLCTGDIEALGRGTGPCDSIQRSLFGFHFRPFPLLSVVAPCTLNGVSGHGRGLR